MRRSLAIAAALLVPPAAASAQTPASTQASAARPARFELHLDAGVQGKPKSLDDSFDVPVYQEQERISVHYPGRGGTSIGVGGRYRIWRQLTVGVGVTEFARTGDGIVQANVPHPFFDNRFRRVEGTPSTRRQETAVDVTAGWRIPLSARVHLVVSAGPAIVRVKQGIVTGITVTESYPYDTAAFGGAEVRDGSRAAAGVYAGGDATWLFSRHLGAGAVAQFTHAKVRLQAGDRRVSVDAGGVQAGGGVRIVF